MTEADEELLAEMLLRWEELSEQGLDTPAADLAGDRPDLVAELERRIRILVATAWLDRPIDDASVPPAAEDVPPAPLQLPCTIGGRYRLDEPISEGGFALVYRAYDTGLQRTVAVKIPKPSRIQPPEAIQAEARRVARLKHDGIVAVFDVGVDGDAHYIVTEYIEGGSLAGRLTGGRAETGEIIGWIADVAEALEYAHLHGVVHRDIKPANILIDHHSRAKLADFGIAQSATRAAAAGSGSLGTLWYMSPEQLASDATDHRSDIYSLAVVLHEALAGTPPYRSHEPLPLRTEILAGSAAVAASIPRRLRPILERALRHSPHQRHPSAAHFAAELRRAAGLAGGRRAWASIVGVAGLAAVAAGALVWWFVPPASRTPPLLAGMYREQLARATSELIHGDYGSAEAGFSQVLKAFPQEVQARIDRGICRMKLGRMDEAVEDFTASLVVRPHDREVLLHRSEAHLFLRQYDRAIADLETVAENFPALTDTPQRLAAVFATRAGERRAAGDLPGAIADLTRALSYGRSMDAYFRRRAECHDQAGDHERALADWTEAIARRSRDPDLYEARARTLRQLGRDAAADADLLKARQARPP